MNQSNISLTDEPTKKIIKVILEQAKFRPIVPFVGSGISVAAGYPTISSIIYYLAKVDFAIQNGVYKKRYPSLENNATETPENRYRQHPSEFIRDFGWPNLGGLDADLWEWLQDNGKDVKGNLDQRDYLLGIVQSVLRAELKQRDKGTDKAIETEWNNWKTWRKNHHNTFDTNPHNLLNGDWEQLLDKLCEGDYALADQLFNQFEQGLYPTQTHRLLVFLQSKLGIPLIMTTNFDTFLERAFNEEGIKPKIFDVHRDAELPDYSLVNPQFSILKLHGSAYGLRFGERLKLKLETDNRTNALNYIPKNSLILVIGFSGYERRMMQLLTAFVEDNSDLLNELKLIWIQGPGIPGPLFKELGKAGSSKVKICKIKHADTFSQNLYFEVAKSHQSSIKAYSSLPGNNYLTELEMNLPNNSFDRVNPILIFVDDQKTENSRSWATLAGTAFVQSLSNEGYKIIWIDLENHQTLESVLAEVFNRIKLIDPYAPSFNISIPGNSEKYKSEPSKPTVENMAINKAVERVLEVLKRGRYVLSFDSFDSFGRQPLGHHGIPNYSETWEQELGQHFNTQLERLTSFILRLIHKKTEFRESYLVLTIEKVSVRHPPPAKYNNPENCNEHSTKAKCIDKINNINEIKNINLIKNEIQNICNYGNFNKSFKTISQESLTENFSKDWLISNSNPKQKKHFQRAQDVYELFNWLSLSNENTQGDSHTGILTAFVCWLSIYRRPSTLPIHRSMVDLLIIGKKFTNEDEDAEKKCHERFDHLLNSILATETNSGSNTEDESTQRPIGIAAQKLEGGSVWLFREAHEACYEALTENLHFQKWVDIFHQYESLCLNLSIPPNAAILDGLIAISWHYQASFIYHVDVYLPTQDIQAFYEYFYHRISALRTITLLIEIISRIQEDKWEEIETNTSTGCNWLKKIARDKSIFYQFGLNIKTFPNYNQDGETDNQRHLVKCLLELRVHILTTTVMALKRNKEALNAYSVPEMILSWSKTILVRDLPEIKFDKKFFLQNFKTDPSYNVRWQNEQFEIADFEEQIKLLEEFFEDMEFKAFYAKLDFEGFISLINGRIERKKENAKSTQTDIKLRFEESICKIRCLIHINLADANKEIEELEKNLLQLLKKESKNLSKLRDLYAYKAKSFLAIWTLWGYFIERGYNEKNIDSLDNADDAARQYEIYLRNTCETKDDELTHRAEYFAIRARILYLKMQFTKAHGYLDLADSNSQPAQIEHRVNAGMVHILRAEMLAISADFQKPCSKKVKEIEDVREIEKKIQASLKKIARAELELQLAENIFGGMTHQKLWQVYMKFGFARLQLERMLFEIEKLYLDWKALDNNAYLKLSGKIEQSVLDTLSHLRFVFDLLPFNLADWATIKTYGIDEEKQNIGDALNGNIPTLIKIEIISYALWNELFVVGVAYSCLADLLKKLADNKKRPLEKRQINDIIKSDIYSHCIPYSDRWKAWNKSMRFHRMHEVPFLLQFCLEINDKGEATEKPKLSDVSLRKAIIETMGHLNTLEKIGEIWNIRRKDS